jgi:hypothetical protein
MMRLVCVGLLWLMYSQFVAASGMFSIPIWMVGGLLMFFGFTALAIIFGILSFILIFSEDEDD